ncbi:MAG: PTS fructose transporter subunit IIA [Burkholderiales bacterium]|nr:PTS fructose transporter subunit IIA [Burkholderiales bacterium]
MAAVLLIAHAPLASALLSVAGHCYEEKGHLFEAIDVEPSMSPETVESLARAALARLNAPEVLVLTDVFGATPCNVAQRLADGVHVRVVAGVNVPMLWRSLCYLGEPLDALVARAVSGASQGVMQVAQTRPQNQVQPPLSNDPNPSRHQQ